MKKLQIVFLFFLFGHVADSYAAKADTLQIPSMAMNKTYKAAVVLPSSYAKSKANYPVLYLLHGAYGHFNDWLYKTPDKNLLHNLADQYNIIIVMPEGETFSFYLDSPVNKGSQFETYITKEVIEKVRTHVNIYEDSIRYHNEMIQMAAIKDSIANSLFKEANEIKQEINLK